MRATRSRQGERKPTITLNFFQFAVHVTRIKKNTERERQKGTALARDTPSIPEITQFCTFPTAPLGGFIFIFFDINDTNQKNRFDIRQSGKVERSNDVFAGRLL